MAQKEIDCIKVGDVKPRRKRNLKRDILYAAVRIVDEIITMLMLWATVIVAGGFAGVGFGFGMAWFGTWL